jgi:threonine dehydratase
MMKLRLSPANIEEASHIIDPTFTGSPQFSVDSLNDQLGHKLICKVETLNPIRSFKGRGASYFLHKLAKDVDWLVCASAGNFGQGMAYVARNRGLRLSIFAAETANPLKIERMRQLNAEVVIVGHDFDAAKEAAQDYAQKNGALFVEDGREVAIAEGAGTIGIELSYWPKPLDAVLIPLGDGSLLTGIGCWLKTVWPQTRIIGICAEGAPAVELSWRAGRAIATDSIETIADGIAARKPVEEALEDLRLVADDVLLVSDQLILKAMRLLFHELGLIIEPSGAVGVAASLTYRDRFSDQLVATILSGGNSTMEQVRSWLLV